ncbi:MAG TPA: periplasmic heavy metal sensor [Humidesulfovibrio sp.]|uniref:periplasmic heavy metal sensor n=1 Tax=Humidesulfovibrio sp. TaxID=2910988 RepID=UPI002BA033FA|nr:periplasmic heavy metal sensor [Humidesulfovibrio sp.]HWR02492.1 periplasmic heavy metal sensor [Humidesulfovibrio sp.]
MKRTIPLMAAAASTLLLLASLAFGQQMSGPGPGPMAKTQMQENHDSGMRLLGVSPEKRESIRMIQADYKDRLFRLHQDIYAKTASLNAIMLQPQPDTIAAKAVSRETAALRIEEMDLLIEMHARIARETGVRMPMGTGADKMMMN